MNKNLEAAMLAMDLIRSNVVLYARKLGTYAKAMIDKSVYALASEVLDLAAAAMDIAETAEEAAKDAERGEAEEVYEASAAIMRKVYEIERMLVASIPNVDTADLMAIAKRARIAKARAYAAMYEGNN